MFDLREIKRRNLIFAFISVCVSIGHAANIDWDNRTLTLVQKDAAYGRMIRLTSGEILCCYEYSAKVYVRTSTNNGKTWHPMTLVAQYSHGHAANPEIIQLHNGVVFCFYNERPRRSEQPYTIMTLTSKDRGRTWSAPRQLYRAGREFENGCWEPAAIQLPDGEVQLFFTNEGPYRSTNEQEITLIRSFDHGSSWSKPERISFRAGHRDGMPVPLVLRDKKGIVAAIEDNGLNGTFKPVILYTSLTDIWHTGCIVGKHPRRWSALKTDLPATVYAGAPYLCQLPCGVTLLSVQSNEGTRTKPQMVVYLGDSEARNFADKSIPFAIPANTRGVWNSLFVKGDNTITALSTTTIKQERGLWAIDGNVR